MGTEIPVVEDAPVCRGREQYGHTAEPMKRHGDGFRCPICTTIIRFGAGGGE